MWGVFVGIGLGLFQVLLLRKTAQWMTADKRRGSFMAVPVIILKLGAIIGVLYLLALNDLKTMMWGAGGLAVSMITFGLIFNARYMKKMSQEEED